MTAEWAPLVDEAIALQSAFDKECRPLLQAFAASGGRLFCSRGCGGCCTLAVQTTIAEALAVARSLDERRRAALARFIPRLTAAAEEAADLKDFLRRRRALGPCPFLEADGACGVYRARPLSCRALFSTRPPEWCAVDFADLHPLERQAFLNSLDPAAAFPTHYLAAPQELALELENRISQATAERFGFAVTGDLPYLVWLEVEQGLSGIAPQEMRTDMRFLFKAVKMGG